MGASSLIDDLPDTLGFNTALVVPARRLLLVAHNPEVYKELGPVNAQEAWLNYRAEAEAIVDQVATNRPLAQLGLAVAQALIWRDCGDYHKYQLDLLDAEVLAQQLGATETRQQITNEIDEDLRAGLEAEREFRYDDALEAYIELEQDPNLSDLERGRLNHCMAVCYEQLIMTTENTPTDLEEYLQASIGTAMVYLEGTTDQAATHRLLDDVSPPQKDERG